MIKLTFPDGSIKEYRKGIKVIEVIESISISLKKKCIAGKLNGTLLNLEDEIHEDGDILFITPNDKEAFETYVRSLRQENSKNNVKNDLSLEDLLNNKRSKLNS